jgi:hypothetical protein
MTTLRKVLPLLLLPLACFPQGNQNNIQLGVVDASASAWKFPTRLFANLPSAASSTGQRFTVTDCLTSACTAGSGTLRQDMVSTGSAWVPAVTLIGATAGILYAAADSTTTHALFATAGAPAFRAFALTDLPSGDAVGTGTLNVIPKWSNTTGGLEDSVIKDDGTAVTFTQNAVVPFTSVAAGAIVNTLYLNAGNVGIGTAGPWARTTIVGSGSSAPSLVGSSYAALAVASAAGHVVELAMNEDSGGVFAWWMQARIADATTAFPLVLNPLGGNVGIGTASPGLYSFDVSRGIGLTGTARFFDQTASTGATLVRITPGAGQSTSSLVLDIQASARFGGSNSTAAVAGLIGTTCPALTCTAAYTWVKAIAADNSVVYFPVWK